MYTFKEIDDKSQWTTFLESYPLSIDGFEQFSFIQSYEWLEFQRSLGRETYPLGIFQDDKLVGIAAGIVIRAKRGKYLYIRNGPVIDWKNEKLVTSLINHLKDYAKKQKLWFIRISPLICGNTEEQNVLESFKFPKFAMNDVEALDTFVMNIEGTEEEVFNSIKKKTRYEIRKAMSLCETFVTTDPKYIDDFYKIEEDTVKRNGWLAYPKEYIRKEFETYAKDGNAIIVLSKHENKYIAGGVFISFCKQSYYHYGASLTDYRHIPASYSIIWEAIKEAKKHNSSKFNFWGITYENAKESHPWTGLTRFKMKFPGEIRRYISARDIPISPRYWLTNTYERIDKRKKGY